MNNIQSKDPRRETYEISRVSLSYFDNKYRYKTTDVMDQLLVSRVNCKKTVNGYSKNLFC